MARLSRITTIMLVALLLAAAACGKTKTATNPEPSGSFGLTKDASIAAELPAAVASKGALTIATDASYPPDEFFDTDNKTIIGFDVDLGNAIGTVLGVPVTFKNATFSTIIPGLSSGKFDLGISSFTDSKEREKTVDFVTYFQAGASIFVAASSPAAYKTLDELCGKTVSAEKGTTEVDDANAASTKCVSEGKKKIDLIQFDDQNAANLAVINGRAVASLADSQVAAYQAKVTNGKVKITGDYLSPVPYGIAIPRAAGAAKGSGPLTKAIFDAVKKLFDTGAYRQILQKWGVTPGAITAPTINGAIS